MTDFDKLIKEKAEQAEYDYRPAAWKSFRRMSGVGRTGLKYWVAGVASAVVAGGGILWMLNRQPQSPVEPAPASSSSLVTDTLCEASQPVSSVDTLQTKETSPKTAPVSHSQTAKTEVCETPAEDKVEKRPTVRITETPAASPTRLGRPLVIDVDTIKDNLPTDEEIRKGNSRLF